MPASDTPSIDVPRCRRGERVAVIAPSSPIRAEMLEAGCDGLRALGLEPVLRDDIHARWRFTAGTDARRLAELEWAATEPGLSGIFLARGGYGLTPLLSRLPPGLLGRSRRLILGESDATALGCLALRDGVGWLHGPMVAGQLRLGAEGFDEASLAAALFDDRGECGAAAARCLAAGEAEGVLWGGCLSILAALCGTPWMPRVAAGILVIEDVGVKPYQVHRMLVQLRDAGALAGTRGVLLGDFSEAVQHPDQGYDVADVLADFFRDTLGPVPVSIGWPVGHATAPHLTLPMGALARLTVAPEAPARLAWRR